MFFSGFLFDDTLDLMDENYWPSKKGFIFLLVTEDTFLLKVWISFHILKTNDLAKFKKTVTSEFVC